ncbi:Tad domain-containing protein [Neobacillus sp. YIM B06451]|uniref:Tad domain-containing protein n=1 Tax=Neobacillus sp. YIM B06451 TaxID=3070994 RepID=UPI0029304143|nr:Tad domain-containing protein [Neobacillus sp. YIM B06451]
MLKILRNENGNVMVIVAVFMIVLLGFTAMVVDVGSLYLEKSKLQKALDAAVLAGAKELLNGEAKAKTAAIDIAKKNGVILVEEDFDVEPFKYIKAPKTIDKSLFFAKVIGLNNANVSASSKAQLEGGLIKKEGVVPLGIKEDQYKVGENYSLKSSESINGNFGYLELVGDKRTLRDQIIGGAELEVSENLFGWTDPGEKWGQVVQGFESRIAKDNGIVKCQSFTTADDSCQRVIIVPMVKEVKLEGKTKVEIVGFAAFYITRVVNDKGDKIVEGKFIQTYTVGEFGGEKDYGIYKVSLVE